jgi:hypothetical protein
MVIAAENRSLVFDLVAWVAKEPRSYDQLMEAWRTSCPRLQVWEEATDLGLIVRQWSKESGATVALTERGRLFLESGGIDA